MNDNTPTAAAVPAPLCKYGQRPTTCTSSPMDCQCAIDAVAAVPAPSGSFCADEAVEILLRMGWDYAPDKTRGMKWVAPAAVPAEPDTLSARLLAIWSALDPVDEWRPVLAEAMDAFAVPAEPVAWSVQAFHKGKWADQWPPRTTRWAAVCDMKMYEAGTMLRVVPLYAAPQPESAQPVPAPATSAQATPPAGDGPNA